MEASAGGDSANAAGGSTPATQALLCPKCGAELRGNTALPGQRTLCLNCNARFVVPGGDATPEPSAQTSRNRPKSPGFWLVQIAAAIVVALALIGLVFTVLRSPRAQREGIILYCAILAIDAWMLFRAARALQRIDEQGVTMAWRAGLLGDGLPNAEGSSLGYILPLGVIGGLLPIFLFALGALTTAAMVWSAVFGGTLFIVGLAMDDLRQFLSRQHALAAKILFFKSPARRIPPISVAPTAILLTLGLAGFGLANVLPALGLGYRRSSTHEQFWFGVALLTVCIPVYRLASLWDSTVAAWRLVGHEFNLYRIVRSRPVVWMFALPILGTVLGVILSLCESHYGPDLLMLLCIFTGFYALFIGAAVLLRQVHDWRLLRTHGLNSLAQSTAQAPASRGHPVTFWLMLGAVCLAMCWYISNTGVFFRGIRTLDRFLAVFLGMLAFHYPLLWLFVFFQQFTLLAGKKPVEDVN